MTNIALLGLDRPTVWNTESAFQHLHRLGIADDKRTARRHLRQMGFLPKVLKPSSLADELNRLANRLLVDWAINKARDQNKLILFVQLFNLPSGGPCLHANDTRGSRYWLPLQLNEQQQTWQSVTTAHVLTGLTSLQSHVARDIAVFPHGQLVGLLRQADDKDHINLPLSIYQPILKLGKQTSSDFCYGVGDETINGANNGTNNGVNTSDIDTNNSKPHGNSSASCTSSGMTSRKQGAAQALTPHLKRLEAESIHIIREAVAEAQNPVLLYSIGKDSSALLHLIHKAFYPTTPTLPMLHVDTRWKFQEMYLFRDHMAKISGMDLLLHTNPEAIAQDINPFDHGMDTYINVTKVEGLKQAIDHHKFDLLFGGARRDEEKSRAKERIFSFRSASHHWDPKQQRPELWNLYNTKKNKEESIRVFPLSNWTELDIWQYIYLQNISVVPLYFAKKRPVVQRNGTLLMVDDDRFRLMPSEIIEQRVIRFRSLGCYPLTGAIESSATNVQEIIMELINATKSERQGRVVDHDSPYSMEKKKQEGHF